MEQPNKGYPVQSYHQPIKRYCQTLDLRENPECHQQRIGTFILITSLGAAFLVMAIVGGAIMPPLQGLIIDQGVIAGHPAVNVSFVLPLFCFLIITIYGYRAYRKLNA